MITTIRRGEIYPFATMDPAVLDEVRDMEWAAEQTPAQQTPEAGPEAQHPVTDALSRLFGRRRTH